MEVVKQEAKIVHISHAEPELFIEESARICYQSHDKITPDSAKKMINNLMKVGHHSPFEFVDIVVDLKTDLNTTHQMVRHRLCNFLQRSHRYVRLDGPGFKVIEPVGYDENDPMWKVWRQSCQSSYDSYCEMIAYGAKPQQARRVLPGSTSTLLRVKANIREWMHIIELRHDKAADPQMFNLMSDLVSQFAASLPVFFGNRVTPHNQR